MHYIITLFISIMAGMILDFIRKWLDRNNKDS